MQLDKFKNTWQYLKQQSDLPLLESKDILSIIQPDSTLQNTRQQVLYFNIAIFLLLVLFCQGG